MTMMQKMQAKQSKKGFTLVELVIVIAILAILAAIAIPVITTTINSAKISTMESDTATIKMLVKEAINTSKASISTTTWNGNTADKVTLADICKENNIDDSTNFYQRKIGADDYYMVYDTSTGDIKISGGSITVANAKTITGTTSIATIGAAEEGEVTG